MTQIDQNHAAMVAELTKPAEEIIAEMTPRKANLIHMIMGVSGETGELLDAIKKHVAYNKPIDREHIIEELGDIEYYLQGLRAELGITRDTVLSGNISKLRKRYAKGSFSNEQAQARADKGGAE